MSNIISKSLRSALTRLRISAHDLNIERGRYVGIDRRDRLCNCCNMSVIEDEYHFLLVCPLYRELRMRYFPKYFCNWPNIDKLYKLLNISSNQKQIKLALYINNSFKHRSSFLNLN